MLLIAGLIAAAFLTKYDWLSLQTIVGYEISLFCYTIIALIGFYPVLYLYNLIKIIIRKRKTSIIDPITQLGNSVTISKSPQTNDSQVILTIENSADLDITNCHAKITRIQYKNFGESNYHDLPTTNKNLKWDSVDSPDGFVTLKNSEDLALVWAKKPKSLWDDASKFGFSYILHDSQSYEKGFYKITVRVEGILESKRVIQKEKEIAIRFHITSNNPTIVPCENENDLTSDMFPGHYIYEMTKARFERELGKFINDDDNRDVNVSHPPNILTDWRILRRRRTSEEISRIPRMDDENKKWETVFNVEESDSIKLIKDDFRGINLDITYIHPGLLVEVNPEEIKDSIDILDNKGVWKFLGYRLVDINEEACVELLKWLQLLREGQND